MSPVTQWKAHRLRKSQGAGMDANTAWILVRLSMHPEEVKFSKASRMRNLDVSPGLHFDDWRLLSLPEKRRRTAWLRRHGRSPLQRLELSEELIIRAGITVWDWGDPE
jgi:hypothetical protein